MFFTTCDKGQEAFEMTQRQREKLFPGLDPALEFTAAEPVHIPFTKALIQRYLDISDVDNDAYNPNERMFYSWAANTARKKETGLCVDVDTNCLEHYQEARLTHVPKPKSVNIVHVHSWLSDLNNLAAIAQFGQNWFALNDLRIVASPFKSDTVDIVTIDLTLARDCGNYIDLSSVLDAKVVPAKGAVCYVGTAFYRYPFLFDGSFSKVEMNKYAGATTGRELLKEAERIYGECSLYACASSALDPEDAVHVYQVVGEERYIEAQKDLAILRAAYVAYHAEAEAVDVRNEGTIRYRLITLKKWKENVDVLVSHGHPYVESPEQVGSMLTQYLKSRWNTCEALNTQRGPLLEAYTVFCNKYGEKIPDNPGNLIDPATVKAARATLGV
jgi:hypothetical protein